MTLDLDGGRSPRSTGMELNDSAVHSLPDGSSISLMLVARRPGEARLSAKLAITPAGGPTFTGWVTAGAPVTLSGARWTVAAIRGRDDGGPAVVLEPPRR